MEPQHHNPLDPGTNGMQRRRVYARWPFTQQAVPVRAIAGRTREFMPMTCRNLSVSGAGLISSRAIAVGLAVSVTLRSQVRGAVEVRGRVTRCQAESNHRFDVAVLFDAPIEVREFVPVDPLSNEFVREYVDPGSLRGSLLIVSANPGDRASIARALRGTAVKTAGVSSADHAPTAADWDAAIVTCEENDEEPGVAFLDLYERGFAGLVMLLVPDRSPRVRRIVDKLPLAAVLVKPFDESALLRALAEVLPRSTGDEGRARDAA